MRVGSLARRYSLVVTSAMIVAVVWGGVAAYQLPREEEPKLTWRLANVVTRLPGASPERMESLVTDVLEHAIEQVDDVEHIYSVSRPGLSLIQIELRDSVVDAPPVWRNVRQKLSESALQLPRGSIGPELDDEIMGTFAMLIAVAGDDIRPRQLEEIAEELEDQLRLLDDTTSTSLFGTQREVIQIEPKPALLVAYDLSFQKLADIVQRRNTRQPSGRLAVGQSELLIEVNGELETEQDLREMVLMVTEDGRTVRLGDVAQLQRTIGTPKDPVVRANGQPSIVLGVRCRRGVRLDQYGKRVRDIVQQAQQGLPQGISLSIAHDLSKYTQERMRGLGTSMLIGVSLVFASLLVFMNWRSAIIVTLSIPLTALFVAITFSIVGIPLNEMSVMAVIMAMGLLVDNAIIVTEEVQHSPLPDSWQAAADAGDQLFVPLLVSTLTTVAAFLPIYLLPGGTGEFVRAIPLGVAICLITSLLVATTVVPQLCVMILPRRVSDGQNGDSYTTAARFIDGYRSILGYCCDHPLLLLGATTFAMVLCVCLGLTLRRDFFSPVQRD
ncbi:MAG: efflux RND transporter permease subunit, partial [Planctomycetales bacterium]|nr:efflux RND transporter permease subunit [Planctomycetales bacterium]